MDGDPRLYMLYARGLGKHTQAYCDSVSEFSHLAHPYSNEKEIIALNADAGPLNDPYWRPTLAHEFQHMIHWYQNRNAETWLNEGASMLANLSMGSMLVPKCLLNGPDLHKVLEEQRFRRLGDVRDRHVDIRLIAATNQDLPSLVEAKKFRGDLYFRVSTFLLRIPPLRERSEDIPALAEQFLNEISAELPRPSIRLSPAAIEKLQSHAWPGNIRELRNTLERAALSPGKSELGPEDFGFDFSSPPALEASVDLTLEEAEKRLIRRALEIERGRVDRAAERLGISRSSLYQKIQRYGITISRI